MIKNIRAILTIPLLLFAVACSTQQTSSSATSGNPDLDAKARTVLQQLYVAEPKAQALQTRAKAILVFPDVVKAGFVVGGEEGPGVLFGPDGTVLGHYKVGALSYGLQAGAQSFSQAMFLMTDAAVSQTTSGNDWSVGIGPSVVVVDEGKARSMTSDSLTADVYVLIFGQEGLMAGLGVQGQRISKTN